MRDYFKLLEGLDDETNTNKRIPASGRLSGGGNHSTGRSRNSSVKGPIGGAWHNFVNRANSAPSANAPGSAGGNASMHATSSGTKRT